MERENKSRGLEFTADLSMPRGKKTRAAPISHRGFIYFSVSFSCLSPSPWQSVTNANEEQTHARRAKHPAGRPSMQAPLRRACKLNSRELLARIAQSSRNEYGRRSARYQRAASRPMGFFPSTSTPRREPWAMPCGAILLLPLCRAIGWLRRAWLWGASRGSGHVMERGSRWTRRGVF